MCERNMILLQYCFLFTEQTPPFFQHIVLVWEENEGTKKIKIIIISIYFLTLNLFLR